MFPNHSWYIFVYLNIQLVITMPSFFQPKLLSTGFLSCFLWLFTIVQRTLLPLILHQYRPAMGSLGQIIFYSISATGSPSTTLRLTQLLNHAFELGFPLQTKSPLHPPFIIHVLLDDFNMDGNNICYAFITQISIYQPYS